MGGVCVGCVRVADGLRGIVEEPKGERLMGHPKRRFGGVSRLGSLGSHRMTHSQIYNRDIQSQRKCIREATQATQRSRRSWGTFGGVHRLRVVNGCGLGELVEKCTVPNGT